MVAKIIIKREISEGNEGEFFSFMKELRSNAILQDGYISGETLINADKKNMVLVISKWKSIEDWENWKNNSKRNEIDKKLSKLQDNPTVYEPYVFGRYKAADE
ncbi:MAG: antibiotic biosynthesis monooxygenase [Desulfobacterales bacterium]|nr:antibiotic biosynthesis monooxygenase [Desulfobacterales bacterium]